MDEQVIYDKVCAHLAQQKTKSKVDGADVCCYRTPDGKRCAIGCLIPDEMYRPEMEIDIHGKPGASVFRLMDVSADFRALIGIENLMLCTHLQRAHDFSNSPRRLKRRLLELAEIFGLTPGVEQAITEWS